MNTSIKTSLDQMLFACEKIENAKIVKLNKVHLTDLFAFDICQFIERISKKNANERWILFEKIYLHDRNIDSNKNIDMKNKLSVSIDYFCSADLIATDRQEIRTAELFVSFFEKLGKYYLFSEFDRKDIDADAYIEDLSNYVLKSSSKKDEKNAIDIKEAQRVPEQEDNAEAADTEEIQQEPEETLEELMDQLNDLIGLPGVKQEVTSLINRLKIQKARESRGMKVAKISMHLVFLGNPGTGKTTVARLLSKIYKQLGALSKGQLVEVDRSGLVAGYVGQTALKTQEKIDEAMGGILFIDEAYTLAKEGSDFGQEAIDTILKAMEDHRDDFVVIVAGYPEPMEHFLESNPGLKSRFNKYIDFEDYTAQELESIFKLYCDKNDMILSEDAENYLNEYLDQLCKNKPANFANGREMRNLFETVLQNQADRLANISELTDDALRMIDVNDFPNTNLNH